MTEENSYVVNNDGTITLQPGFLDLIKENTISKQMHNNSIVYLFISKDIPGIKFYNLNNSDNLEFITKRKLVFEAKWSYLINYPNKSMIFRSDIGDIKVHTYLISKKELFRILAIINKENDYDKIISFKIRTKK